MFFAVGEEIDDFCDNAGSDFPDRFYRCRITEAMLECLLVGTERKLAWKRQCWQGLGGSIPKVGDLVLDMNARAIGGE